MKHVDSYTKMFNLIYISATPGRGVDPTVVRTEVEERTTGPREKSAQRETVPQEDADSATVAAREIRAMAQERSAQEKSALERSAQERSAQERSAQEKTVTHQESVQRLLLRKRKMLDFQIFAW